MAEESLPTPPVHPIKKDSACRLELLRRRFLSRFTRLNERMVELVEEFGLVSFTTLNIQVKSSGLEGHLSSCARYLSYFGSLHSLCDTFTG
jgi:hypothetical protein